MTAEEPAVAKRDYYLLLGVTFESTDSEIRSAYLRLALKWHPDKHPGDEAAKTFFQQISEAYHVLSDAALRDAYDRAAEFNVECMALEEYLRRFTNLILTVNGLGSVGLGAEEYEIPEPIRLGF